MSTMIAMGRSSSVQSLRGWPLVFPPSSVCRPDVRAPSNVPSRGIRPPTSIGSWTNARRRSWPTRRRARRWRRASSTRTSSAAHLDRRAPQVGAAGRDPRGDLRCAGRPDQHGRRRELRRGRVPGQLLRHRGRPGHRARRDLQHGGRRVHQQQEPARDLRRPDRRRARGGPRAAGRGGGRGRLHVHRGWPAAREGARGGAHHGGPPRRAAQDDGREGAQPGGRGAVRVAAPGRPHHGCGIRPRQHRADPPAPLPHRRGGGDRVGRR